MRWKPIILVLLLAGCAGDIPLDSRLFMACSGYTHVLESLAEARTAGKISQPNITRIDGLRFEAGPICRTRSVSLHNVLRVETAVAEMLAIRGESE